MMMPSAETLLPERLSMVVVRTADRLYVLPLASVIETSRCPVLSAVSGAPDNLAGVVMIRGATVAAVDLGVLLGRAAGVRPPARLVTLRVGLRTVELAVDSVIGVREFERADPAEVPPMLREAHSGALRAAGALDRELLLVLDGAHLLTAEALRRLAV